VWCYGPEFVAKQLRKWLARTGAATLYIEPGSPSENGYCESFNSKLRDEFLNGEIFYSLKEAQVMAERWRIYYNTERPHSSLGYRPPAPVAWQIEASPGHGKVESKQRFPLFHAPDCGGELTNSPPALHKQSRWYKFPGRPTAKAADILEKVKRARAALHNGQSA